MILNYRAYFTDGIALLRKPGIRGLMNYAAIIAGWLISVVSRKAAVWGRPFSVSIETSAVCNLKCPECATGKGITVREKAFPDNAVVGAILQQHKRYAFYCNLYFQGEPFLNKKLFAIISGACDKGYYTAISTNGHFLDQKNCKEIIDSGLNRLIISLDGIDPESYQHYRRNGRFDVVTEGIKRLSRLKNQFKKSNPLIVVQFLVNKKNESQVKLAAAYVKNLGADVLEFKSMQVYSQEGKETMLPEDTKYNRYKYKNRTSGRRLNCFRLWSHIVYTSDGRVVPCCFDKIPDFQIPFEEKGILDEWKSPPFMDFRNRVLNPQNTPHICSNCIY